MWLSVSRTFSKAFDRVNYGKLFKQLLSDGVHIWTVSLLLFLNSHLRVSFIWNGALPLLYQ